MEDGGLVETGEVRHVLLLVVLRRVHLLHVVLADKHPLTGLHNLNLDVIPLGLLHGGRHKTLGLMRDPDKPLLGPLGLGGGVREGIPVHNQELEVGIRPVHVAHDDQSLHELSLADIKCLPN